MVSSINANTINLGTTSYDSMSVKTSAVTSTTQASDSQKTTNQNANVSSDGDTVTISSQGVAKGKMMKTFTATSKQSGVSEDTGYTDATAAALSSAASAVGIDSNTQVKNENSAVSAAVSGTSSSSGSSSSSSTSDLGEYTETQLKEMLRNGEISQAEYDKEIASRETDSSDDSDSDSSTNAAVSEESGVEE